MAQALPHAYVKQANILWPADGQITAILAELALRAGGVRGIGQAERLAKIALAQDATAVPAVVTLALSAELRGNTKTARDYFNYSQILSRRDLSTQVWAAEDAVARNNISGALAHYDIALRTSDAAPDLMFPVLASAISDPAIRISLVQLFSSKPNWMSAFIAFLPERGSDPRATLDLFRKLTLSGIIIPDEAQAGLLKGLLSAGFPNDAWNYYSSLRNGADPRKSRDPHFVSNRPFPMAFDWIATSEAGVAVSLQSMGHGGLLDFSIAPGASGVVLRQLQHLPPGDYKIDGHSVGIDQPEDSRPYWTLSCADGRELGRVEINNSSRNYGLFSGTFRVPLGCSFQTLALVARPTDNISGVTGQIDNVQLQLSR